MRELYQENEGRKEIFCDEWRSCYRSGWGSLLVSEAFAHPAKVARGLAERIYQHVLEERWAKPGDRVVDPFGGIAGFGFHAMMNGLNFVGVELEQKFVELGEQNIALWNERYSRMPNWGTARLIQGDSRKLAVVLSAAEFCVSSPPYAGTPLLNDCDPEKKQARLRRLVAEGKITGRESVRVAANGFNPNTQVGGQDHYGETLGQLGAMKEGDHSIAIGSPPHVHPPGKGGHSERFDLMADEKGLHRPEYGNTPGQISEMPEGQLCVSSPPFESVEGSNSSRKFKDPAASAARRAEGYRSGRLKGHFASKEAILRSMEKANNATYGDDADNLGNQRGETFWSASRLILEQLHQVLAPNAHAVFVVKAFVRDKKIVDFPAQWAQLCEAVGFKLLHDHHALLVEHYGTQKTLDGNEQTKIIKRASFFRRLAESKGSPAIEWENVLCLKKV